MRRIFVFWGMVLYFDLSYAGYDITSGTIINTAGEEKSSLQKNEKTLAYQVLWDTTRGVYGNYYPTGAYSRLTSILDSNGYTIDLVDSGIQFITLTNYDVIVICVTTTNNTAYVSYEVDSLARYVYGRAGRVVLIGDCNIWSNNYIDSADNIPFILNVFDWLSEKGGILIMSENNQCPNQNVAPLTNAFSMDVGLSIFYPFDLYFTNFDVHPIFSGISSLYFRIGGAISAFSVSKEIAWDNSSGEATIAVYPADGGTEEKSKIKNQISKLEIIRDKILLSISDKVQVGLKVYDLCGRVKEVVYEGMISAGNYTFVPRVRGAGIYFAVLTAGNYKETKKLILMK